MHFKILLVALQFALVHCATVSPDSLSCDNAGLQYAVFENPYIINPKNDANNYHSYRPTYMKAASSGGTGTTYYVGNGTTVTAGGIPPGQPLHIYGSSYNISPLNFSINHRGYLYAKQSGNYTLKLQNVDDIVLFWRGNVAKEGWSRANAEIVTTYNTGHGPGVATTTFEMTAGKYLPIRIIFANGAGPYSFDVFLSAPDGTVLLSSSSKASASIVTNSCDKRAPPFPFQFGAEE